MLIKTLSSWEISFKKLKYLKNNLLQQKTFEIVKMRGCFVCAIERKEIWSALENPKRDICYKLYERDKKFTLISSGMPITAHSATEGWLAKASSIIPVANLKLPSHTINILHFIVFSFSFVLKRKYKPMASHFNNIVNSTQNMNISVLVNEPRITIRSQQSISKAKLNSQSFFTWTIN